MSDFKTQILRLARADIAFFLLPLIMLNLIAGTVAQRELGLYEAGRMFFSTFITWAGPVPLPGGYTLIGIFTFGLLIKFVFLSEWKWQKAGISLSHLGALVLLLGGLFTAINAKEGYMLIPEGQESPYVYDYEQRVLFIYRDDAPIAKIPFKRMKRDLWDIDLPFTVQILSQCQNCNILKRAENDQGYKPENLRSMAQFMALESKPPEKQQEENLTGVTLKITGLDDEQDGIYLAFESMPKPIEITKSDRIYRMVFGRDQRSLPFSVFLKDFKKTDYPGTSRPRAYESEIIVMDNGIQWPARIEMNSPLRYKGYTFYQSAFEQSAMGESTILSVVENEAWLFPYFGTALIAFGLILHMLILAMRAKETGKMGP